MSGFAIRGKITGLAKVLERLSRLKSQTKRSKILRKALQTATKPILDRARQLTPQRTGLLRKSLWRKTRTYRQSGVVLVIIGPRTGMKRPLVKGRGGKLRAVKKVKAGVTAIGYANPNKYAHLVELGTRRSRAIPFLEPAFAGLRARTAETLKTLIMDGLTKELSR